ncbi:site-specific DNA-methyltransferase [Helicobacter cetorum]|uniref:site-specific DNA-methyltransferase (adenine-specific) n=1 Tax=Helicobacter cetorum (strain ATCC BAA-540 / CCUG 52418 / MIT 99-5656) TaxID=1163745 RepID=I0ESK3_HELCM|nr:site-specific DNA-methyltransferase [Helicobacter cetorum]AFI05922.1 type III R-M system methyltransferase [Helicobacter cetorum MIT 99-5656]
MQNKDIFQEKSLNEKNLEIFNEFFPSCLSIENNNQLTLDVEKLKALLGDFSEVKEEGYGLNFVGKKIALNQAFKKNTKILKPLNETSIKESPSKHILIKGDNLDALKILRQSYSEKIKMIYIDPPYNTKNDSFIYSDNFSQSNEEILENLDYPKDKLDYINNLYGSKCHSGWLSFMYPRLLLARDLLKKDGVIFISIDDNEMAQLKLLCDEIFGEDNFVAVAPRKTGAGSAVTNSDYALRNVSDFILIYIKTKQAKFNKLIVGEKKYPFKDELGKYELKQFQATGSASTRNARPNMFYPIYKTKNGLTAIEPKQEEYEIILPTLIKGEEGRWIWKAKTFEEKKHLIEIKDGKLYRKVYIDETEDQNEYQVEKAFFEQYRNADGTKMLQELFGGLSVFSNPKPLTLLNKLIEIATNEGDIILDFFAGSGTTAHAVLESNKNDYQKLNEGGGGQLGSLNSGFKERQFILVQLDEIIDAKKNKSAYDFCKNTLNSQSPSIFDITKERIKRAGAKIKEQCPNLDCNFQTFEIIEDSTQAIHSKNLSEVNQKDLLSYSNPIQIETKTLLVNLLLCESLELTTPIVSLVNNALYLAKNTAFIVGDIETRAVLENLKDKGVERISLYMPAISNDNLILELSSNLFSLGLESSDLKIRG